VACGGPMNPRKMGTITGGQGRRRTLVHLPPGETEPAYSRLRMTTRLRSRKIGRETESTWDADAEVARPAHGGDADAAQSM
jgi:hypothetical protein